QAPPPLASTCGTQAGSGPSHGRVATDLEGHDDHAHGTAPRRRVFGGRLLLQPRPRVPRRRGDHLLDRHRGQLRDVHPPGVKGGLDKVVSHVGACQRARTASTTRTWSAPPRRSGSAPAPTTPTALTYSPAASAGL